MTAVASTGSADRCLADLPPATECTPGFAPLAVWHRQFRTTEAPAAQRFFTGAYRPGWRICGRPVSGRWRIGVATPVR